MPWYASSIFNSVLQLELIGIKSWCLELRWIGMTGPSQCSLCSPYTPGTDSFSLILWLVVSQAKSDEMLRRTDSSGTVFIILSVA